MPDGAPEGDDDALGARVDADDGDDALMARVAGGDEAAFNRLVHRHTPALHRLAARVTGSTADSDEIVQTAFVRLWRKAAKWQPGGAQVSTWLGRVAVNAAIDRMRRRRVRALFVDAGDHDVHDAAAVGAERDLAARQELARTFAAMRALSARQRMALALAVGEERTGAEAAALMGIGTGAFEQLLHRARRALRKRLEGDTE